MIKIIKEGSHRVRKCTKCGCVFSYEKEDIKRKQLALINMDKFYIECPWCAEELLILFKEKEGQNT